MNYVNDGDKKYWENLSSVQIWARTMMANGYRVHGYVGYFNLAPNGPTHYERLGNFFENCKTSTIVEAWREAHNGNFIGMGASDWGVVCNSQNTGDLIRNGRVVYSKRPKSDTAAEFYYWRNGSGNFSTTLTTKNITPMAQTETRINTSNNSYSIKKAISNDTLPPVDFTISPKTITVDQKSKVREYVMAEEYDKKILTFSSDGAIKYHCRDAEYDKHIALSDDILYTNAKKDLEKMGLMPEEGTFEVVIERTEKYTFDSECNPISDIPENPLISVTFFQKHNGQRLLSRDGGGIVLEYSAAGLMKMNYRWNDIDVNSDVVVKNKTTISESLIHKAFINAFEENFKSENPQTNVYSSFAYLYVDGSVKRVAVFGTDAASLVNTVYIDMESGQAL